VPAQASSAGLYSTPLAGGKEDATEAFFGLHRSKVLKKYKRLKIGSIKGEKPEYVLPEIGELSKASAGFQQVPAPGLHRITYRCHTPNLPG
jgi:hypothetical protein